MTRRVTAKRARGRRVEVSRIAVDPAVRGGKPVIRGTRVPVEVVVGALAGGATAGDVQDEYGITLADVRAALAYAAQVLGDEQVRASS